MTVTTSTGEVASTHGRPRWPIFFGLAAIVIVIDQLSKAWLVSAIVDGQPIRLIGDFLRLVLSQNNGAIFGLFRDQAILFGLVSVGVIALIVWFHASSGRNTLLSIALGLLLGGAIGNMLDRFRLGYVVDWIDAGIGGIRFYTFNVADSMITLSILLLIALALFPQLGGSDDGAAVASDAGPADTAPSAETASTATAATPDPDAATPDPDLAPDGRTPDA